MEIKTVLPSIPESYEHICHQTAIPSFLLNLRTAPPAVLDVLRKSRLERAIGVIYRPDTELASHYFQAVLPEQFDDYICSIRQRPSRPLKQKPLRQCPIPTRSDCESGLAIALRRTVSTI